MSYGNKWTFLVLNSTNGKQLTLVAPFVVSIDNLVSGSSLSNIDYESYVFEFGGETLTQPRRNFFDSEKDATKAFIRIIGDFYDWHSDPNNAPVAAYSEWKMKADAMTEYLENKYLQCYPEVFI